MICSRVIVGLRPFPVVHEEMPQSLNLLSTAIQDEMRKFRKEQMIMECRTCMIPEADPIVPVNAN